MIHPAIVLFWAYGVAVLAVALWSGARGLFWPAAVVLGLWLLGIAEQLLEGMGGDGCYAIPAWAYLLMDAMAGAWFLSSRGRGSRLFGATFLLQVGLHVARLMGWIADPLAYWYAHCATAFLQLGVLAWWALLNREPHLDY